MKRLLPYILALLAGTGHAQSRFTQPRYVNYTEFGGLFGRVAYGPSTAQTVENRLSFTAQTFNGAQVSRQLAIGGLVGMDWYKTALLTPVGAGLRFDLLRHPQQNVRLLAIADAGYGFAWFNKNSTGYELNGGWMVNPGLALRVGKPSSTAFVMSLSYKRQSVDVQKPLSSVDIQRDEHRVYNRMCFRVGVSF
ncbi:hypothetical protein [Spirosoma linguale]|uniref:Outer membrane protein beta-barrel domain-containing protein n=1 Tax=Spirosoma linguale (strain ATCC 33905 / DSM 74 / LMG 10896 / Claus 1) TaxID=504472 RepID=D2QFZ7_SPILD|nr:hypothetical protein Slin_5494 [Spirosoma linguale DSM 74]